MALFANIPQFTACCGGSTTVDWRYLPRHVLQHIEEWELNFDPDFQRGYVWTSTQKKNYVEYALRGGASGRDIWTNCPGWSLGRTGNYVVVDGKQRVNAVLSWLNNEFPIFDDKYRRDYTGAMRMTYFNWHVNELETRDAVLRWYCELNAGGTVHDPSEIERVRNLIGKGGWQPWTIEEARKNIGLDRPLFDEVRRADAEYEAKVKAAPLALPSKKKRRK
jgi:hypothetical protein